MSILTFMKIIKIRVHGDQKSEFTFIEKKGFQIV